MYFMDGNVIWSGALMGLWFENSVSPVSVGASYRKISQCRNLIVGERSWKISVEKDRNHEGWKAYVNCIKGSGLGPPKSNIDGMHRSCDRESGIKNKRGKKYTGKKEGKKERRKTDWGGKKGKREKTEINLFDLDRKWRTYSDNSLTKGLSSFFGHSPNRQRLLLLLLLDLYWRSQRTPTFAIIQSWRQKRIKGRMKRGSFGWQTVAIEMS